MDRSLPGGKGALKLKIKNGFSKTNVFFNQSAKEFKTFKKFKKFRKPFKHLDPLELIYW